MHLTPKISIRKMRLSDLPSLADWSAAEFTGPNSNLHWTKETMLRHLNDDFDDTYSFVLEENGQIIGGILAYPCEYDIGKEIFLHTIVIKKTEQGKGIGKIFLKWFIDYAKTNKIKGIRLDSHVMLASFTWYQQFGFKLTGWQQQLLEL